MEKQFNLHPLLLLLLQVILLLGLSLNVLHAHPSWGIVVHPDGTVYFADISHHGRGGVYKLDTRGKLTVLLEDFHAHNVSLDENHNLVVAHGEMNRHTMVRILPDGAIDTLLHVSDYKAFNGGNATYTPDGEIIFGAEHHLWRINELGNREKVSDHYFSWNQTVFADSAGNYYGPDIGDEKGKLIKIDAEGRAMVIANDLITKSTKPYDKHADILMGMASDDSGDIYIAELAGQRVVKITSGGKTESFYRSEGNWMPTGLYFHKEQAYILEYTSEGNPAGPRIVRVNPNGNRTVIFNYDTYHKGE